MSDGESDDGRRAAKKRKASRACDRCNSQHQPCDNATPKCSVCVRAGTECTYNRPVRKRGPRSGYTGQNGERLWAIVLQARPDVEDLVLQVLRSGNYGATGIPNLAFYRNNDNQAELVSRFNESRLGRFLQNGESADLNLPPLGQEPPALPSFDQSRSETGNLKQNDGVGKQPSALPHMSNHRRISSNSGSASGSVNPHGPPQNPGDIYLQSQDIRRRVADSPQDQRRGFDATSYQGSPAMQNTPFGSNSSVTSYHEPRPPIPEAATPANMLDFGSMAGAPRPAFQSVNMNNNKAGYQDFQAAYQSRWLDSVPRETLLNLGFAPGEGMQDDFFELCANPDPIDSTPTNFMDDQGEDEEAIWRRLVLKGRFT
ncbi:hypothetical protein F4808DRAFT_267779 [Astrocystis sublimbata]|nr:hypothetical protein F4808DRAFT_267779 [Astrocystis sublimbata]